MISEWLLKLSANGCGYGYRNEEHAKVVRAAIARIQERMKKGGPIVAIHVPNPRYLELMAVA